MSRARSTATASAVATPTSCTHPGRTSRSRWAWPRCPRTRPRELTELSRFVAEIANISPNAHQPYVGVSAFAHKGGVHGAAMAKVQHAYQHIDPALVGNDSRLVVCELGGRVNTRSRAEELGHRAGRRLDARGAPAARQGAGGRRAARSRAPTRRSSCSCTDAGPDTSNLSAFLDFTVIVEKRDGGELACRGQVKVEVDDEVLAHRRGRQRAGERAGHRAAQGAGAFYPVLDGVHLSTTRCASSTATRRLPPRRACSSSRGRRHDLDHRRLATNIIAASAAALVDSLEYAIWKSGAELRRRDERQLPPVEDRVPRGGDRAMTTSEALTGALHLARWTINSGSNIVSRGAVQIVSGDHRWESTARGQRPDRRALRRGRPARSRACSSGHPRLLSFELRALRRGAGCRRPGSGAHRPAGGRIGHPEHQASTKGRGPLHEQQLLPRSRRTSTP